MRTVSQVIEIAKDWVEDKALSAPGFYGAYLAGSVCRLDEAAPFAGHRDVDIYVLLRDSGGILTPKVKRSYKRILVDGEFHSLSAYRSPDAVAHAHLWGPSGCPQLPCRGSSRDDRSWIPSRSYVLDRHDAQSLQQGCPA